jgi:hypothetical protein
VSGAVEGPPHFALVVALVSLVVILEENLLLLFLFLFLFLLLLLLLPLPLPSS